MRQWRIESAKEIDADLIHAYINESVINQEAGKMITATRNKPIVITDELKSAMEKDPTLATQFDTLTKGKKREYADYINEAKRETTRMNRLKKSTPMTLSGFGLNDRYRK